MSTTDTLPPADHGIAQPVLAGMLAAMVGYASSFPLVLAALAAGGATPVQAGTGLLVTTVAVALLNLAVAWRTRRPLSFAWSTPGAAFLITVGAPTGGYPVLCGALLTTAALIVLAGLSKHLARAVAAIPPAIASAMLAGILLTLCLAPLHALQQEPLLALPIIGVWAIMLKLARRYAVPAAVVVTIVVLAVTAHIPPGSFDMALSLPAFVLPQFTLEATIRIALPLFIITMASQNLPGLAVMQVNGYKVSPAPQFLLSGAASAISALLGGITVNLAAITAAICAGPEAHPNPARRWIASFAAGWTYLVLAGLAGYAAAFVAASPPVLIQTVAGLALFASLSGALARALADEADRLPAILTFVTAASGITLLGIGAAFWALVGGIAMWFLLRPRAA
ncbi:benzoate/H(+) symporter BenE family transporter [Devosia sp.]|uniref:benzoate/H(+) symporter BenE family transporter n=1 Tax=Devosia sp. TaxID=1871048 RepID=UPI003BAB4CDF